MCLEGGEKSGSGGYAIREGADLKLGEAKVKCRRFKDDVNYRDIVSGGSLKCARGYS